MSSNPVSQQQAIRTLDYLTDFPELPPTQAQNEPSNQKQALSAWAKPVPKFRSSTVTQVFHLPAEERSHKEYNNTDKFGEKSTVEQQKCIDIGKETGTTIESCESKDHTLTIMMSGKRQNVEEARKRIVQELQTQASKEI
jgi:hypothetical protein